jgi:hypothetical protein
VSKRGILDECLAGLSTASDFDIVRLRIDVGQDPDAVPNARLVGVSHVTCVERTVAHVDQPIIREANRDRGLVEAIDALGTHGHQAIQVRRARTRLELDPQRAVGGCVRITAPPTVASRDVRARASTLLERGSRFPWGRSLVETVGSGIPSNPADLAGRAGTKNEAEANDYPWPNTDANSEHGFSLRSSYLA